MKRVQQEAMRKEMIQADKSVYSRIDYADFEKVKMPKWRGVKYAIKEQQQKSFHTEEEIQQYLVDNPQYVINQRFGFGTKMINLEFYERGYAVMDNSTGYNIPKRWLTPDEVEEYLKAPKAVV